MQLSIIIVNYNVRYFLEQCLHAVRKAISGLEAEVIVVDNNSVDGSVEMVREKFPEVTLIENNLNVGFSKANNQALKQCKGRYILLLNPDTIVEDTSFTRIVEFMDEHPEAGGLGVKMVDGNGKFLPESKRGLPTPWVAFYKIFGLSAIFPKSKIFGKYHQGYLDNDKIHEVEVLSGAFMLIRYETLQKTGFLDETFFMYGEDIDLSYRILKAGYKNYYFPGTRIIHYKGESTKKSSINYVFVFYNAMIIFARKHFSAKRASALSFLIHLAVYFRAFLAILNRFFSRATLPIIDAGLLTAGLLVIKNYWEVHVIFPQGGNYPPTLVSIAISAYVVIWLFSVFMSGGYDRPIHLSRIFRGLLTGTIIILIVYALLPEIYRFSRAIIIFGAVWGMISMFGIRIILHLFGFKKYQLGVKSNKRYAVVGEKTESERVADLLRKSDMNPGFIGLISVDNPGSNSDGFIGTLNQLKEIINIYKINEVIFCAKDMPARQIIDTMSDLNVSQVGFKIAPPESLSIIGSQSINTSGDIYIIELDSIARADNRRSKRFLDIVISIVFIPLIPLAIFIVKKPAGFLLNILKVIVGRKTWVGYRLTSETVKHKLPPLKKGVLNPVDGIKSQSVSTDTADRLNILYARDYKIMNDLNIIFRGVINWGRN